MNTTTSNTSVCTGSSMPAFHPLCTGVPAPPQFTYPFCYEPHPLCMAAAREVQQHIASVADWQEETGRGKMFGVLVVRRADGATGYLAAYSGLLAGRNDWPWFVPPVFDSQQPDGHFKRREAEISALNAEVSGRETSEERRKLLEAVASMRRQADSEVEAWRRRMAADKQLRDEARRRGTYTGEMTRQSQFQKAELRRIRSRWAVIVSEAEARLHDYDAVTDELKCRRRTMSDELQQWLFSQYAVLDAHGHSRSLVDIFREATGHVPPSGAGDCCAPKLLQYAYRCGLQPVCMAEFWWGASPRAEIRHHLHYYPACRGKCLPILTHMLRGLDVEPDPLAADDSGGLDIVYEDESLAVVCKPAGMLSVPGRSGRRSVLSLMRARCPEAEGPMMAHRLDMATSGLLVVAKTTQAYHHLQAQFAARTVSKTYVALLENRRSSSTVACCRDQGRISLPLRPDPLDRPRQVADPVHGHEAVTEYRLLGTDALGRMRIELHPLTGRTHQLRVHCAHPDGLGRPIVGDTLYGRPAARLCLHARSLEFTHPVTGKRMRFDRSEDFQL